MATSHCLPSSQFRAITLAGASVCDTQEVTSVIEAYAARVHEFIKIAKQIDVIVRIVRPILKRVEARQRALISVLEREDFHTWDVAACRQTSDVFDEMLKEEADAIDRCVTNTEHVCGLLRFQHVLGADTDGSAEFGRHDCS